MKSLILITSCLLLLFVSCATETDEPESNIPVDGKNVFKQNCILCHGADGKLMLNGALDLSICVKTLESRVIQITNGKGLMTGYRGILSSKEINAVAAYSMTLNPSLN